jgi:hypothetical protein
VSITNGYLTVAEATAYTGKTTSADPTILEDIITACSRMVDRYCGRHFFQVAATARIFDATTPYRLELGPFNDLVTLTTLKSDDDGSGTYEVTYSASQYQLAPPGATTRAPLAVPYTSIELLSGYTFPSDVPSGRRGLIEVTGTWGWPTAVPTEVKQATRVLVAEVAKLQDAPFGVLGNDLTGVQYAPRQMPNAAKRLLQPFVHPSHVGIG